MWTSSIKGYDSIESYLAVNPPSLSFCEMIANAGRHSMTILQRLERFLQSSGISCPNLFEAVWESFSPIIDLSQISSSAFRPQMFAWAITGSPFIDPSADDHIHVSFILPVFAFYIIAYQIIVAEDGDQYYAGNSDQAHLMMSLGRISF